MTNVQAILGIFYDFSQYKVGSDKSIPKFGHNYDPLNHSFNLVYHFWPKKKVLLEHSQGSFISMIPVPYFILQCHNLVVATEAIKNTYIYFKTNSRYNRIPK